MTPEEHLKKMRQDHRWNAPDPRPRTNVFAAAPRRAWGSVAIGVGLIALSAVVVVGAVSLRSLPRAEPADTPTATATYESERPVPRLDLACSDLLPNHLVDDFVGTDVTQVDYLALGMQLAYAIPDPAATVQAGGIACEWANDDPDDFSGIFLKVVPGAGEIGGAALELADSCKTFGCHAEFAVGTTWVEVITGGENRPGVDLDQQHHDFTGLQESITTAIENAGDPTPIAVTNAKPLPAECDAIVSASEVSEITGESLDSYSPNAGVDSTYPTMPDIRAAELLGMSDTCGFLEHSSGSYGPTIMVLPGAAWMVSEYGLASGEGDTGTGTVADVPGLNGRGTAVMHCEKAKAGCALDVALDGNWVKIYLAEPDMPSPESIDYDKPRAEVLTDIAAQIVENLK